MIAAVAAVLGVDVLLKAVIDQRVEILDRLCPDVASPAPVAAIRSAEFDELLAPERDAAVPARTRADIDFGGIQELHDALFRVM
jgi:hypothetical protein